MRIRGKNHDDFQVGTFIDRFPSDCRASMTVKGLKTNGGRDGVGGGGGSGGVGVGREVG